MHSYQNKIRSATQQSATFVPKRDTYHTRFSLVDNRPKTVQMKKIYEQFQGNHYSGFGNEPIQRMVKLSSNGTSVQSDGKRPNSHLNKGAIKAIILDIVSKKPSNEIEEIVLKLFLSNNKDAGKTADVIKKNSWLTNNLADICHKVPYASMEKVVIAACNSILAGQNNSNAVKTFKSFILEIAPSAKTKAGQLLNAKSSNIVTRANALLRALDAAPDNLKFGFSNSNRSLGQHFDFHYNVLGNSNNAQPPSPRGPKFAKSLHDVEDGFNLNQTEQDVVDNETGGDWIMTSDVYGKKSDDTGQVFGTKFTG